MKKALAIILALTISIGLAACTTANSTPSDVETSNGELNKPKRTADYNPNLV